MGSRLSTHSAMSHDFLTPAAGAQFASGLLTLLWWLGLNWLRKGAWRFAVVALAGTALHELMHFLVGAVLGARPVSVSLFPKQKDGVWTLGSVEFETLGLWNSAPVALAPLLLLPIAALGVLWGLPALLEAGQWTLWFVTGYVTAAALQASLPSSTDWRVGGASILLYSALGAAGYFGVGAIAALGGSS